MFRMTLQFEAMTSNELVKSAEWNVIINTRETAHRQLEQVLEALEVDVQPVESPGDA